MRPEDLTPRVHRIVCSSRALPVILLALVEEEPGLSAREITELLLDAGRLDGMHARRPALFLESAARVDAIERRSQDGEARFYPNGWVEGSEIRIAATDHRRALALWGLDDEELTGG